VVRYGAQPVIASVSFGAARDFMLRRKSNNSDKYTFSLGGGAAPIMHGMCQQTWEHSLPARKGKPCGRINLTFRRVI
jgi:alkylated DNA repair dioxygenase AlkB